MRTKTRPWLILIVLCLVTMVLQIDTMALTVAIPDLSRDLGASAGQIQWINVSYILVFAGLLLTAGSFSDRFGRKRSLITGLVIFGLASSWAMSAGDPTQLIFARVLMGIGATIVLPSTMSIPIVVFDDSNRRKALSIWSSVGMIGLIGGPVLAGVLVEHFSWRAVFVINIPIVLLSVIAALILMPESKAPARPLDPVGLVLSVIGIVTLVWSIIAIPDGGLTRPSTTISMIIAVATLITFVIWETRSKHPMVPLALFRDHNFSGGSLSITVVQFANGGLLLVMTQYLQFVLGYTPLQSGLALIPLAIGVMLSASFGSTVGAKIGNRPLIGVGMALEAGSMILLGTASPSSGLALVIAALGILGLGGGLAQPAATNALMSTIPHEHAGVGSALNDTVQQTGSSMGIVVLGSVSVAGYLAAMPAWAPAGALRSIGDALTIATRTTQPALADAAKAAFTDGMSVAFLIGGCVVLAGAVISVLLIRDSRSTADDEEASSEEVPVG